MLWLLAVLCAFAPSAAPHPNSWSRSLIVVEESGLTLFTHLQFLSVVEVVDADPDGNGFMEPEELEGVRLALDEYVRDHYVVRASAGDRPLEGVMTRMELVTDDADALSFAQYVDLEFHFEVSEPLHAFEVEMTMFFTTSPAHQDVCDVVWFDGTRHTARLHANNRRQAFVSDAAPPAPSLVDDVRLGIEHIVFGYDHLAFLMGLLVASRRLAALVGVVTAFTLAHSVTLALAALDVVSVPERPVEIVIALSIAWVGLANLVRRGPRPLWIEAFVFGLVHGLGFATALAAVLADGSTRLRTLIAFNVGIEIGQVACVVAVVVLVTLLPRSKTDEDPAARGLVPPWLRTGVSVVVLVLGGVWAVQRALLA